MAKCEEGYLCEVCGQDVEHLRDSGLYLQFILGWIDPETLHTRREVHITCVPTLAQFIDDPNITPPTSVDIEFDRAHLDASFVEARVRQVTEAYHRLRELDAMRQRPPVTEYPLPATMQRWQ